MSRRHEVEKEEEEEEVGGALEVFLVSIFPSDQMKPSLAMRTSLMDV